VDIRNQYAFSQNNFVGQTATRTMTSLVVAPSANGESVLKPCLSDSFIPENANVALAHRANADSEWQPVRSVAQFQELVQNTPADQLGQNLGVWTDKRSFYLFGSRDGVPQNREVQTFGERWQGMQTTVTRPLVDKGFRTENRADAEVVTAQVGLEAAQISIDPKSFEAATSSFPGKEVGFFYEVGKISQHDIYMAQGAGQPADVISHGGGETPTPLFDAASPKLFRSSAQPTYVMPKVLAPGQPDSAAQFQQFS
jgi:hypothetical protein